MDESDKPKNRGLQRSLLWPILGLVVVLGLLVPLLRGSSDEETSGVSLRMLAQAVEAGEVERIVVKGDKLVLERLDGSRLESRKEPGISAFETFELVGLSPEALQDIEIEEEGGGFGAVLGIFLGFAPLLFFVFIGYFLWRQFSQGGRGIASFTKSKPRVTGVDGQHPDVTFADVAGANEAKRDLVEIVDFLKAPARFAALGAKVPRGALLVGPPGTGKTLLARAVAGEASVPFFTVSGSEFVELFVGAGASKVRDLFQRAKAAAPSIIFVDEIDAVGRRRGVGYGSGNDEREQTLNQILVEMDGFDTGTNVIVIAATNRADVLDEALLRPGRFDRRVLVDRPDVIGREAILRVHAQGKPLTDEADLTDIAKLTVGFSGADLANLLNEAAILAARAGAPTIGMQELNQAFERIVAGPEQRKVLSEEDRRVIAYHEAGHALVMETLPDTDPVHKISIVARGAALGYTMPLPERDKTLRSKESFIDDVAGLLGGRAAEELSIGRISTGASNDLSRATSIARAMVTRYGMTEALGLRIFDATEQAQPSWPPQQRDYAEGTALKIDAAIADILEQGHESAKAVLRERWEVLTRLVDALLERETLDRVDVERIVGSAKQPAAVGVAAEPGLP